VWREREENVCLLAGTIFRHPVWDRQSTSPPRKGEREREREKEPPFVKSIHSVVTWKLGVVPVRRNNFPIRG